MLTLNRLDYIELRESANKNAGILGDAAERCENADLDATAEYRAYDTACTALDALDALGYKLGYLDAETNEYISRDEK